MPYADPIKATQMAHPHGRFPSPNSTARRAIRAGSDQSGSETLYCHGITAAALANRAGSPHRACSKIALRAAIFPAGAQNRMRAGAGRNRFFVSLEETVGKAGREAHPARAEPAKVWTLQPAESHAIFEIPWHRTLWKKPIRRKGVNARIKPRGSCPNWASAYSGGGNGLWLRNEMRQGLIGTTEAVPCFKTSSGALPQGFIDSPVYDQRVLGQLSHIDHRLVQKAGFFRSLFTP